MAQRWEGYLHRQRPGITTFTRQAGFDYCHLPPGKTPPAIEWLREHGVAWTEEDEPRSP